MSKRDDTLLLEDIVQAAKKILSYVHGFSYETFAGDIKTQGACIRNFEIIGEAASKVSTEVKQAHENIPWRKLSNYRNLLIHEYFGVNLEIVWDIIERDLPEAVEMIDRL